MMKSIRFGFLLFLFMISGTIAQQNDRMFVVVEPIGTLAQPVPVEVGKTVTFSAKVFEVVDPNLPPVEVVPDQLDWSVDPAMLGDITPTGDFTALPLNGSSPRGQVVATAAVGTITVRGTSEVLVVMPGGGGDTAKDYTFSGIVTDDAGMPISGAVVRALSPNVPVLGKLLATTNNLGEYTLTVPQGSYYLQAEASGFISEWYDNANTPGQAKLLITDPLNKTVTGINFTLSGGATISGTVTASENGSPIQFALVTAFSTSGGGPANGGMANASTDVDGKYIIAGMPAGVYIVQVNARGYKLQFYNLKPEAASADKVDLSTGGTAAGIDFVLDKIVIQPPTLYPVSGVVRDGNGSPIADANVVIEGKLNAAGVVMRYPARTDGYGMFSVSVPAGQYTAFAEAQGYFKQYYDHVSTQGQATYFLLDSAHTEKINVDFSLRRGGMISGVVLRASDQTPIERAWVGIAGNGGNPPSSNTNGIGAWTNAQGEYTITGLQTGEYFVVARMDGYDLQYYDKTNDPALATKVQVIEDQTTAGIDFELTMQPGVTGNVTDAATGLPIPRAEVVFEGMGLRFVTYTDPNGDYIISLPPGIYKARASSIQYAAEWYNEKSDAALADDIVVATGQNVAGVDFTLETWNGGISGIVTDESAVGIAGAQVRVWLAPTPSNSVNRLHMTAVTNADGSYEILGLPPGEYFASASAKGFITEYFDNVPVVGQATAVIVTNAQTTQNINFSLALGGSIAGRVTDAVTNKPVPYAFVQVRNMTSLKEGGTRANLNGEYVLEGLATGDYVVLSVAQRYLPEYYNNAAELQNATPVTVTAPAQTSGIDFTLEASPFSKSAQRTVSGRVIARNGADPLVMSIIEAIDPQTGAVRMTTTNTDGSFQLSCGENAVVRARAIGYVGSYAGDTRNWQESRIPAEGTELVFALDAQSAAGFATLNGQARETSANTAIPNAWIFGTDNNGNPYFSYTDLAGRFALNETSTGTMDVLISAVQYQPTEEQAGIDGNSASMQMSARKTDVATTTKPAPLPTAVTLSQNYPNPFNPGTTFTFTLPAETRVSLKVYNLVGTEVATVLEEVRDAGTHRIAWNASQLSSGIYLYKLQANGKTLTRQMTLLK